MIYIQEGYNPDDELPPMSGTRVGHEMLTENVICIKVQHAQQSFRSSRRELHMLDFVGDRELNDELLDELLDCGHKTAGRRPLA